MGKLVLSIPVASADGRYYGRYPQGNPALMAAAAVADLNAAGSLTTGEFFAGAARASASAAANLTTSGGSVYAVQSLQTGINNGVVFEDDAGGNSAAWMTDSSGGFARINWTAGGTAGLRWFGLDPTKKGIYVRYDVRRNSNPSSKEFKIFSKNYPSVYSNCTWGCNTGGYAGTRMGLSYSDKPTGGDIDVGFWLDAFPTLTGGSAYSVTPHPTAQVVIGGNEHNDGVTWDTHEYWWLQNDDGLANGEAAQRFNGTLIFWVNKMINCGTSQQGFSRVDLGGYTPNVGLTEDYRNFAAGYSRPVWLS